MSRYRAVVIIGCLTLVVGCGVHHGQLVDHPGYRPAGEVYWGKTLCTLIFKELQKLECEKFARRFLSE